MKIIKIVIISLIILSLTSTIYSKGWVQLNNDWYYIEENGEFAINKWHGDYYLGSAGKMETNKWISDKYYVGNDGKCYYNSYTPDGYFVGKDGKWDGKEKYNGKRNNNSNNLNNSSSYGNDSNNEISGEPGKLCEYSYLYRDENTKNAVENYLNTGSYFYNNADYSSVINYELDLRNTVNKYNWKFKKIDHDVVGWNFYKKMLGGNSWQPIDPQIEDLLKTISDINECNKISGYYGECRQRLIQYYENEYQRKKYEEFQVGMEKQKQDMIKQSKEMEEAQARRAEENRLKQESRAEEKRLKEESKAESKRLKEEEKQRIAEEEKQYQDEKLEEIKEELIDIIDLCEENKTITIDMFVTCKINKNKITIIDTFITYNNYTVEYNKNTDKISFSGDFSTEALNRLYQNIEKIKNKI